jgi:hypothetical protein
MKKELIILLACFFVCKAVFAQQKKPAYRFHSINTVSLLNGANEVSAGLQSVNGFRKGNWFAGMGAGLDYYIHRSVPLFADVRYEFGKKENKFFAYAAGGLNLEWVETSQNRGPIIFIWEGNQENSDFDNGLFTDAGMGYLVKMKKAGALLLSLGHSYKTLKHTVTYTDWRSQEQFTDIYHYRFSRISVKLGWMF